ncbi:MAG: ribonuclease III [Chloroflexota bacterium]|nr:ribonuclease III [Chloroflexota bacterium]
MRPLEARLGYRFTDRQLLFTALVHRSYANETNEPVSTNERLEFLGDAVLAFVVAERLYALHPSLTEGELTRARASLVNRQALATAARQLHIGEALVLGRGASASGGHRLESILSDTFEAVLGAVYLDGGLEPCYGLVDTVLNLDSFDVRSCLAEKDCKTRLQEETQSRWKTTPEYRVLASPPEHQDFRVEAVVDGEALGVGAGSTKAQAEQEAAAAALQALDEPGAAV